MYSDEASTDGGEGKTKQSATPGTLLYSDDPRAWEAALTRPLLAKRTSAAVTNDKGDESGRNSEHDADVRDDHGEISQEVVWDEDSDHVRVTEEVSSETLAELDRVRLNLLHLRDAVQSHPEGLHRRTEGEETEEDPQQPHRSWTIHSHDDCRMEEVSI